MVKKISVSYLIFFLFSLTAMTLLNSCEIEEVQFKGIENVKVLKFDNSGVEVEITVKINNPNKYRFKVNSSDLNLLVNNSDFGKVKFKDKIKIAANCEKSYTFVVYSNYNNAISGGVIGLMSMLKSGKISMNIKGDLRVSTWGIGKKYPIDFKQNVSPKSFGF